MKHANFSVYRRIGTTLAVLCGPDAPSRIQHAHVLRARHDPRDLVAGLHLAFLDNTEIESGLPCAISGAGICGSFMRMPTR